MHRSRIIIRLVLCIGVALRCVIPIGAFAGTEQAATDDLHLPGPTSRYTEINAGIPAHLDYFAPPVGPAVVFSIGETGLPADKLFSLDIQGQILNRLLDRLIEEHSDISSTLEVSLGDSQSTITEVLRQNLVAPGANWDGRHGRPKHGEFGTVLEHELDQVLQSSSIAAAFKTHGYTLKLTGITHIDIRPVKAANDQRLPVAIDMLITATKIP